MDKRTVRRYLTEIKRSTLEHYNGHLKLLSKMRGVECLIPYYDDLLSLCKIQEHFIQNLDTVITRLIQEEKAGVDHE